GGGPEERAAVPGEGAAHDGPGCGLERRQLPHDRLVQHVGPGQRLHETRMCCTRGLCSDDDEPGWPVTWATSDARSRAWAGSFTTSSAMSRTMRAAAMSSRAAACRCSTTS